MLTTAFLTDLRLATLIVIVVDGEEVVRTSRPARDEPTYAWEDARGAHSRMSPCCALLC